jgi:hypothetical protein
VENETIEDAVLAANLLKSNERIDPDKVYILGHSLGGMLFHDISSLTLSVTKVISPSANAIINCLINSFLGEFPQSVPTTIFAIIHLNPSFLLKHTCNPPAGQTQPLSLYSKNPASSASEQNRYSCQKNSQFALYFIPMYNLPECSSYNICSILFFLVSGLLARLIHPI